jgi:hypothetical protein
MIKMEIGNKVHLKEEQPILWGSKTSMVITCYAIGEIVETSLLIPGGTTVKFEIVPGIEISIFTDENNLTLIS